MLERFGGHGLYIPDEPEAPLSPQLAVLSRMHELVLDDSQFIVATHSPILIAYGLRGEIEKGRRSGKPKPAAEVLYRLERKYTKMAKDRAK
jgi:predicted ATPase